MKLLTKRLILRDWKREDIKDLMEGVNDLQVSKWLAYVPYPYTRLDAKAWIERCIADAKKGRKRNSFDFAIELKSEKKVIGGTGLIRVDRSQGTAGGGIWLSAKYHGLGYGTEAFGAKAAFAFGKLGLRRIGSGYFKGNSESWAMQKKLGYKREGLRRKAFRCMADGKIKDEVATALLKEDFKK
jgi:RimJ/RimL family protein N-acetyltransferase